MRLSHRFGVLLSAGVLALSLSTAALAQGGRGRGPMGPVPAPLLAKLNLNDEQKAKVKAAGDVLAAELEKARALQTPEERRPAGMKAMMDYRAALQAALTPEQQQQLMAMMQEARQFQVFGPMAMQFVGMTPPLTDEQKTKLKEIGAKYEPEIDKARAAVRDASDKQAARQQMMELMQKVRAEVLAVLTPEQQKQLTPLGRRRQQ